MLQGSNLQIDSLIDLKILLLELEKKPDSPES